jgi:hypothetical protein
MSNKVQVEGYLLLHITQLINRPEDEQTGKQGDWLTSKF